MYSVDPVYSSLSNPSISGSIDIGLSNNSVKSNGLFESFSTHENVKKVRWLDRISTRMYTESQSLGFMTCSMCVSIEL